MSDQTEQGCAPRPTATKRCLPGFGRAAQGERGQALVEFALTLPIMLILIFAMIDFGRGFYTWLMVTNAAREGARVGATQAPIDAIHDRVYDAVGNLDSSDLTVSVTNPQGPRGEPVEVNLTYSFQYITPIGNLLAAVGGDSLGGISISAHSSMRLE